MTIENIDQKISGIISRIDREIEQQAAIAGRDLVALITNRVVQKGDSLDGSKFTPYSDNKWPAKLYLGQSRTGGAESKVKALAKKNVRISYRDFRVINGLNPAPKNFEFTGDMWRNFGVVAITKIPAGLRISIGGKTGDAATKISENNAREKKSIIRPSKAEIAIVQANLTKWAQSIVDNG